MSGFITYRDDCRLCGSGDLRCFLHFDQIPLFDEVVAEQDRGSEFSAPMDVYWCGGCQSVQTRHDVNVGDYYSDYQYVASSSPFIQRFMRRLAEVASFRFGLKHGDRAIEIGAADGYFLACLEDLGVEAMGFEPAANLCKLADDRAVRVVPELFTADTVSRLPVQFRCAQLVVLLHTFDHLQDPVPFLESVREVLDPVRGVLILEVHDLADIVRNRETSLFGHEHATYLHSGSMRRLLQRCGFDMVSAEILPRNERRGSSMLIAAARSGNNHFPSLSPIHRDAECLDQWATFQTFSQDVRVGIDNLRRHVKRQVATGKRVAGYGAWGRGLTTLAMADLTSNDLVYVCDRNEALTGLYTPVSGIRIVSPEVLLTEPADEVIVFCHGYIEEIRESLRTFTARGAEVTSVLDLLAVPERT
ncbi:MAG: methyltransferase domain-containing protein [Lentisphaerae bacterium]|nr:methyltransferase domain-containing protein [Lentisphaerota bacterium]